MKLGKKVSIIFGIVIAIVLIVITTDYLLVQNKKEPLLCKKENVYWDGGSYECFGLGYKVNVYKNVLGEVEDIDFGSWNLEFNK